MRLLIFLLVITFSPALAQTVPTDRNSGKDFHERESKTIDEILKKNQPGLYKTYTTQSNFLVVANYRNGKRWRYFEGDVMRFKTNDGKYFEEEITTIDDSSFTLYRYNNQIRKLEMFSFSTDEIEAVYKHKKGSFLKPALISMVAIIPYALFDWYNTKIPPTSNQDFLVITPIVGLGNALLFGYKDIFNKQKLRKNKELKIVRPVRD